MPTIPANGVNWSATAAWIALVVSVVGNITGPLITSHLNNKHQLKMYKLKAREKQVVALNNARISVLTSFISNTGKCISHTSLDNISDFGFSYFSAYQYIPEEHWGELDKLYEFVIGDQWDDARAAYIALNHVIAELLKEPLQ